ncbi:unnamed protein product, partial [Fusarium langsethiae]
MSRDCVGALQAASYVGREKVVELLISRGANIMATGGKYGDAFTAASGRGHESVVRMLLANGAGNDAQKVGEALQAALSGCHTQVVKLLVDHGASLDLPGKDCGHTLASIAQTIPETDEIIQLAKLVLDLGNSTISPTEDFTEAMALASGNGGE